MPMHLDRTQIDRYLADDIDAETHAPVASHLAVCVHCNTLASRRALLRTRWERRGLLGRLVRVDDGGAVPGLDPGPERRAA
jgi:hypothetical protein